MPIEHFFDIEIIAKIDPLWFWAIFCSLSIFSLIFLHRFYKNILHARALEDTPTAKIRSASQGYNELKGTQMCLHNQPLIAPLSRLPCTWYQYKIERYQDNKWVLIERGASEGLFVLDDGSSLCFVDPNGANVTTPEASGWRGHKRYPNGLPKGFFARLFSGGGSYRYQEWRMQPGMPLYAIGNFFTFSKHHFTTQHPTQQVSEFMKRWKKSTHRLFTGDNKKDLREEDIDAALDLATQYMQQYTPTKIQEPYFHILTNAGLSSRKPYVLSGFRQKKIVSNYKIDAFLWFLAFIITTSFITWFAGIRMHF